jgi:hypothetical protein
MFPDLTNDLSRLYKMLVHHLPTLTQLVVQVGNVFVFLANSITNVIGLLVDFGDNVAALIHALPAGFREIAEAMAVFSLSLIRSPVFWFIAGLTVLLGLLDDYMVWQKNPKGAAFDWSWTKGLDHFMKCILGIKGGFSQLFLLLGGLLFFIRPLMGLAGAVLNIGTKAQVAAGMVGGLRSALALLAAVWGSRWLRDKLQEGSDWLTDKMFGKGHAAEIEKMHQQGGAQFPDWFHHMMDWLGGRSPEATTPTSGGGGTATEPMQPSDPSAKRNMRNFNPGNLNFAGQEGAVLESGPNPRFARFPNMIAGVAATVRQLQLNQQRGINTLRGQITRWAPAFENDTTGYIRNVARMTGLDPDARLDTNDPAVLAKLVQAITTVEGGKGLDADTVSLGVQRALGSRPILPPGLDNTRTQTADAGGRGGVVINQQTSVHVAPGPTAGATAREVADQQGRVNENLVRNTAGILR